MNKIRKWIFKFLTGYDLKDYREVLELAGQIIDLNESINKDNREILAHAKRVIEFNEKLCKEMNENV